MPGSSGFASGSLDALARQRLSRRSVLRRAAALGLSAPMFGSLLVACVGDDDDEEAPTATQASVATPTAAAAGTTPTAAAQPTATTGTSAATATAPAVASLTPAPTPTSVPTGNIDRSKVGGTYVYGRSRDVESLDPHIDNYFSTDVIAWLYENLTAYTLDLDYEPLLSEKWEVSDDGLLYTFHLRDGITFHDDTPFNAEAVKFTADRLVDPDLQSPLAVEAGTLTETEVVDDLTVGFHMSKPYAPFIDKLTNEPFTIMSPTAVEQHGEDFANNPVGTGPFKFKERTVGEQIVLERYEAYQDFHSYHTNKGAPYLDEYVVRVIPDDQTRLAALETGEIHEYNSLPPEQVAHLSDSSDIVLHRYERPISTTFLEFTVIEDNGTFIYKPPLDDIRLRQAIGHAINRDEIIEGIFQGLALPLLQILPIATFAHTAEADQHGLQYDPDLAKQLLEDAGWTGDGTRQKDGQSLELLQWVNETGQFPRIAQLIQSQLGEVGMDVKIETFEAGTFYDSVGEATHHFDIDGWGYSEPDFLYAMITWGGAQFGFLSQSKPEVAELLDQARETTDREKRIPLYNQAQQLILEDVAVVPLIGQLIVAGVRKEAVGATLGPFARIEVQDVYIEE